MLSVYRINKKTVVLGPGTRAVIWFHGCSRNCQGCIAKRMNETGDFKEYSGRGLAENIISGKDEIEGVTLSGGEPFEQNLLELDDFLTAIQEAGLSVMCYTGNEYASLKNDPKYKGILSKIDILVDGPYIESQNNGELWRGSSNQQFIFLSDRYAYLKRKILNARGREIEMDLNLNNELDITGIPERVFLERIEDSLSKSGIEIAW